MLEAALSYPMRGDDGLARIAIGGVIVLLAAVFQFVGAVTLVFGIGLVFLVVGWVLTFPVFGYTVEVLASVSRDEEDPPAFDDWTDLTVLGFEAFVVSIVYLIPAFLVITVLWAAFGAGLGAMADRPDLAAAAAGVGVLGMFLSFVVYLAILYVLPAAITNVGRERRIGAAFDFQTIGTVITSSPYIVATVLAIAISVVVGILWTVAWFTIILGIVLLVLGPFVQFWLYLVFAYLYGSAFGDAIGEARQDADADAAAV